MPPIWLVSCPPQKTVLVRREIEALDAAARLVRVAARDDLVRAAGQMRDGEVRAALYECGAGAEAEQVVDRLVRTCGASTVLVLVERLDAGCIARLFAAGATEVIAAGGSAASRDADGACAGEGTRGTPHAEPPADDIRSHAGGGVSGTAQAPSVDAAVDGGAEDPYPREGGVATARPQPTGVAPASPEPAPPRAERAPEPPEGPEGPPRADGCDAGAAGADGKCDLPAAPLVVAISGRGGCGKTTIVAAMAWCAARMGLRAAVIDLDLMFGDLHRLVGIEQPCDLGRLVRDDGSPEIPFETIEETAMRVAPGLTVWGPCALPEHAELLGEPVESLVSVLRREADVIFVDTSVFWGDAVASTVSHCDRCLVVGSSGASSDASTSRAVSLAARIGVPKTRMTSLFARLGAPGCSEERAMRFEMSVGLRSHARISDGGTSVAELLAYGKLADVMGGSGPFVRDVQAFTQGLVRELGCPLEAWDARQRFACAPEGGRSRIRLPWNRKGERPR